jgi:hypothetical protein
MLHKTANWELSNNNTALVLMHLTALSSNADVTSQPEYYFFSTILM